MNSLSSLYNVHKKGLFGDYQNKNQSDLIKISEIKSLSIVQIFQYKSSKIDLNKIIFKQKKTYHANLKHCQSVF